MPGPASAPCRRRRECCIPTHHPTRAPCSPINQRSRACSPGDSRLHGRSRRQTTPLIARVPKCELAREPVSNARGEAGKLDDPCCPGIVGVGVPPRMQMGLPRGRRMAGYRHCPNLVTMVLYTMDSEGHASLGTGWPFARVRRAARGAASDEQSAGRRHAKFAGFGVFDRSGVVARRAIPNLLGGRCRHDVFCPRSCAGRQIISDDAAPHQ